MLAPQEQFSTLKKRSKFLTRRFRSSSSSSEQPPPPHIHEWKQQQQPSSPLADEINNSHKKHASTTTGTFGRRISRMFQNTSRLSAPPSTCSKSDESTDLTAVNPHRNSDDNYIYYNNNKHNNNNNNNLLVSLFHGRRSRCNSANIAMSEKIEIDSQGIPEYALPTTTPPPRPSVKEILWNSCPGLDQFSRSRTSSVEKYQCHNNTQDQNHLSTPPSSPPPPQHQQLQGVTSSIMIDDRYVDSTTSTEDEDGGIMTPISATTCSGVMFWDINQNDMYNNNNNHNKNISLAEQVHKVLGNAFHEADEELEEEKMATDER